METKRKAGHQPGVPFTEAHKEAIRQARLNSTKFERSKSYCTKDELRDYIIYLQGCLDSKQIWYEKLTDFVKRNKLSL